MSLITTSEARDQLVAGGVTGPHHSHSRQNTIAKINALVEGDADGSFGLSGADRYPATEVLSFLSELTGCSADITHLDGFDTIDPAKTMAGIVAAARRLRQEATRGSTLLTVTGHPTGLLEHHIRVVDAYRKAGGKVIRLREEEEIGGRAGRHFEVRYIGNVGCAADWGSLKHTHSASPMEALLEGDPWPDLVLGDHGFAGAALERGIPTIAVMDINDPALAVAWAEKKDVTIIPMDDNRPPRLYEPSWRLFEQILRGEEP
jgi:hypothetical protein